jgi:hypothetical protein
MTSFLPYFAGIITLIFGIGFGLTILRSNKKDSDSKSSVKENS